MTLFSNAAVKYLMLILSVSLVALCLPIASYKFHSFTDIEWVEDKEWFQQEVNKGCCPYASELYQYRYEDRDFRCCTDRLNGIDPLKPVGDVMSIYDISGIEYPDIISNMDKSILIYGDSIAEQHFLFVMCHAWSLGKKVELKMTNGIKKFSSSPGTTWEANIGTLKITYYRWYHLNLSPDIDITKPDYLIITQSHHETEYSANTFGRFLDDIDKQRTKPTIIAEAMVNHFPGGYFSLTNVYPPTNNIKHPGSVCDAEFNHEDKGIAFINSKLSKLIQNRPNFSILKLENTFIKRGDLHPGVIPGDRRDCLHLCVVTGVFDVIGKKTLVALASLESERKKLIKSMDWKQ